MTFTYIQKEHYFNSLFALQYVIQYRNYKRCCYCSKMWICKRLYNLAKVYPPLDKFSEIDESIFTHKFRSEWELYFVVHIYADQYNIKIKVIYGINFSIKYFRNEKQVIKRVKRTERVSIMNEEIEKSVINLVKCSDLSQNQIVNIIKNSYNIHSSSPIFCWYFDSNCI